MKKVIVVTSGKGGVGKTTFCANLGVALSAKNKKTVLVEGDIGLNNLDVVMGVEGRVVYDIGDVIFGKANLAQALVKVNDNLYMLPATTAQAVSIDTNEFLSVISGLEKVFDYVIIDSPAGVDESFHRAVKGAHEAIVITTPHVSSIRDANKVIRLLAGYPLSSVSLVVNRVRGDLSVDNQVINPTEIAQLLKIPLVGVVPEDDDLNMFNVVTKKDSASDYSYFLIASYINGEDKKIYDCVAPYKGLLGRLRRRLR